jgi:hypothetical protein
MIDKINLDQLCAEYGSKFAKEVSGAEGFNAKKAEVLITKALGVLQEQGLYAFVLFCKSRPSGERAGAEKIKSLAKDLLKELELINDGDFLDELRKGGGLLTELDDLMLAVQVLEKSLIYARFHAKAMKESQGEK